MNDRNSQTYPVAPPSIALAMMAFTLAYWRTYGALRPWKPEPVPREEAMSDSANGEHYRIIDRLSRGEKP